MPLYEYECDACGHRFERIQKFSDPLADTCPTCGGAVHKLISSPAIQFKGAGFYITDYPKKEHVTAAKADSGQADKSEKADKSGTSEKSEKGEKGEKGEKREKSGKSEKPDTSVKADKTSSSTDSSSSSSSTPSTSTSSTSTGTPPTKGS